MFRGTGGAGVKSIPSEHSKIMPEKCVTCHMHREGEDKVLERGGHTFRQDSRACLKCHESPVSMMAEWKKVISPLVKELELALEKFPDKESRIYKDAKLNYDVVIADAGIGAHNPRYAQALLQHSISALALDATAKPEVEKPESQESGK